MGALSPVRQQLANQFLAALQEQRLPWQACWQQSKPQNAITGKLYRGVNAIMLTLEAWKQNWNDPRWCTYLQAQQKGWQVHKGEHGMKVEYWAYWDKLKNKGISLAEGIRLCRQDPAYTENLRIYAKSSTVFHASQIDGIPPMTQQQTNIDAIRNNRDTLLKNMGLQYEEKGEAAYYDVQADKVVLPPEGSFDDTYAYLCTFLHECGHATGHESRLNRDMSGSFGSESYAMEELRVEIASAFAAQEIGLQLTDRQLQKHMELHKAYIQNWADVVGNDPEVLFKAIKAADTISDYLIRNGEFLPQEQPKPVVPPQAETAVQQAAVWELEQS